MKRLCISAGHGKYIRGAHGPAPWGLDEVDEARRVTERVGELLNDAGVETKTYWDDVSHSKDENLRRICDWHNAQTRDLDISVHFNSHDGSSSKPVGTECWYYSQSDLAAQIATAIADAGHLIDRGPKYSSGLYFLNHTEQPACLIEVMFLSSKPDTDLYLENFDAICVGIAEALAGRPLDFPERPERPIDPDLPPDVPESDEAIRAIAMGSAVAVYEWKDRGVAPPAYIQGFALAWAQVIRAFNDHDPATLAMAVADKNDPDIDALSIYADRYRELGMSNRQPGLATLRHLYALLLGLGMRESSGEHCCGRDQSAENVQSDTAEAGLYQTSYNAHDCHPTFDVLMQEYEAGLREPYLDVFSEDVECSESNWACYGTGAGADFQRMCKTKPAFAVESCALVLRNRCLHYGPIKRQEAELLQESNDMLLAVERYVAEEGLLA